MIRYALAATVGLAALAIAGCTATGRSAAAHDVTAHDVATANAVTPVQAQDSYYVTAHNDVEARAAERGQKHAKNVILFIGDGMGVSTITAARIFAGQAKGVDGESYRLAMEKLPYSAFSKTYTHDAQVADSANWAYGVKPVQGSRYARVPEVSTTHT